MYDCCYGSGEGAMPEFSTTTRPRARQVYRCIECGDPIVRGENHECVSGMWEGRFDTFRTCLICARIRDDFCRHGFTYGELREVLRECLEVEL